MKAQINFVLFFAILLNLLPVFAGQVEFIGLGDIQTEFWNPMLNSLKKNANESSYHDLTTALVGATEKSFLKPGFVLKPKIIANTISKIVNSKKPITRYLVGKYAKPIVFTRKYFGVRIYDKIVMGTFKSLMK